MNILVLFLICWLLCTVAFAVAKRPAEAIGVIEVALCGALIAIAIAIIPSLHLG